MALTYYSHDESARQTAAAIEASGAQAKVCRLDATKSAEVNSLVGEIAHSHGGSVDILVNNAGHLVDRVEVQEMSDAHWHSVMDVNLLSAFDCTRAALPFMGEIGRIACRAQRRRIRDRASCSLQGGYHRLCAGDGEGIGGTQDCGERPRSRFHRRYPFPRNVHGRRESRKHRLGNLARTFWQTRRRGRCRPLLCVQPGRLDHRAGGRIQRRSVVRVT